MSGLILRAETPSALTLGLRSQLQKEWRQGSRLRPIQSGFPAARDRCERRVPSKNPALYQKHDDLFFVVFDLAFVAADLVL